MTKKAETTGRQEGGCFLPLRGLDLCQAAASTVLLETSRNRHFAHL